MKFLKLNKLIVLGLSTVIFAGGLGLINNSVNASTNKTNQSQKVSQPGAKSTYWNQYRKVKVTKDVKLGVYNLATPTYKSTSDDRGVLKKGTTVYVTNIMRVMAGNSFSWIVKNNQLKSDVKTVRNSNSKESGSNSKYTYDFTGGKVKYIWNVQNTKNDWFKLVK